MPNTQSILNNLNECVKELAAISKPFVTPSQVNQAPMQDPYLAPTPLMKDYQTLINALKSYGQGLPPLYQTKVVKPLYERLEQLGPELFTNPMIAYPGGGLPAQKLWLAIEAVFQHSHPSFPHRAAINSFQEVVIDLYDNFLSNMRKQGFKSPDHVILPPLVRSSAQDIGGPMTMPVDEMLKIGVESAIVYFPPEYMRGGLLAWSCWSHEVGGHDILHAHTGVLEELSDAVIKKISEQVKGYDPLITSWAKLRIDESASDILGILNMGPMAALGFIGFFRAMSLARNQKDTLNAFTFLGSSSTQGNDPHPTSLFRAYLAASALRQLSFHGAEEWAKVIDEVINTVCQDSCSDLMLITENLVPIKVSSSKIRELTDIIAKTVIGHKLEHLGGYAFGEIRKWSDEDESMVKELRPFLYTPLRPLPADIEKGYYAVHVTAAAMLEVMLGEFSPVKMQIVFNGMITLLDRMHRANTSWGQNSYRSPIIA